MPDYVPGAAPGGPPPAWIGTLKTAIRALDPRAVWDLNVQLGYQTMDLGIQATSWANDEVDLAIRTAIKSVKRARAAQDEYRRNLAELPPEARARFEADWRGRVAPLFDKLSSWLLKVQEILAGGLHRVSGQLQSGLQSLRTEVQALQSAGAWQFSGMAFGRGPAVFGAGPAVAVAPPAAATVGLSVATVVALTAIAIAGISFAIYLGVTEINQGIYEARRQAFINGLPPEVRADPARLAAALEAWEKDRKSSAGAGWARALEALGKALPWVAAAGIASVAVKVWLDWRRDADLRDGGAPPWDAPRKPRGLIQ